MESVDDNVELHITVFKVFDDASESVLVSHALTDDEQVGIGVAHEQQGIRDQGDGRRVDDDIVVAFLQLRKQLVALL